MNQLQRSQSEGAWVRRLTQYLYVVDLVSAKRILEVGCGSGAGAEFLANHGAKRVVGIDTSSPAIELARGRHRRSNLEFRCERPDSIEIDDGAFDCVFVPDGAQLLRRPAVLEELRRVLAANGHLVLCAASADRPSAGGGASYYEFVDRLGGLFPPVRMIAQSPFVAMSLVEYAPPGAPEPDIELDTTLLEASGGDVDATAYVAVCGGREEPLRGFTIIQLPPEQGVARAGVAAAVAGAAGAAGAVAGAAGAVTERRASARAEAEQAQAKQAQAHAEQAQAEAEQAQAEAEQARAEAEQARAEAERARAEAERERGEAERARAEARALRGRLERREGEGEARVSPLPVAVDRPSSFAGLEDSDHAVRELDDEAVTTLRDLEPLKQGTLVTVSERIAEAMAVHAARAREFEDALDERQAYADELRDERDRARAAADAALGRAGSAEARALSLEAELSGWRTRAAVAEGELLRARNAAAEAAADAGSAPAQGDDRSARVRSLEEELADARRALDRATANWKQAEAKNDDVWRRVGELQSELEQHRETAVANAARQRQAAQVSLTRAMEEASKRLVSVKDQLLRAEKERDALEARLAASDERRAELESALAGNGAAAAGAEQGGVMAGLADEVEGRLALVAERLRGAERVLSSERELLDHLEAGIQSLRAEVASAEPEQPSGWETNKEDQLRAISRELGTRDAELTLLHVGLSSVRERLREVLSHVRDARREMDGRSAAEMLALMDRLAERLTIYEGMG